MRRRWKWREYWSFCCKYLPERGAKEAGGMKRSFSWREVTSPGGRRGLAVAASSLVFLLVFYAAFCGLPGMVWPEQRAVAQAGGELIFESADYDIKDGTAPTVVDGVAYLFAGEDPWAPPGAPSKIVALDASTGGFRWERELPWAGGMGSKARPLVDSGRLYIGCGEYVFCLDTSNGGKIWFTPITPAGGSMGNSVIITDPVMYTDDHGTKVVVVGDYIYGAYVALNAETGSILWRYNLDPNTSAIGTPGVDDEKDLLYLPQHTSFGFPANGKVYCLDVSGEGPVKKWEYRTEFDVAGGIALLGDRLVFSDFAYGGPKSKLYCLQDRGSEAALLWSSEIYGSSGTPLVDPDAELVYVCGNDYSVGGNHMYAFDAVTGSLLWDNPNWGAYNGNCVLSPGTGYLYAGSFDTSAWAHNKGIAALDPLTGSELWSVTSRGGGDPVVVGDVVYTTADGRLYAYSEYRPTTFDWYFAEGCTIDGFDEWLSLANPGTDPEDDTEAVVRYIFNGGRPPLEKRYPVPAGSRVSVFVNTEVGEGYEVSLQVVSDRPLVAERPVYFHYRGTAGRNWTGGHCVVGADEPRTRWYFAEGYTGEGFEEYLSLANPQDQEANVKVTFLYNGEESVTKDYQVSANSRRTLNVNQEAGEGRELGLLVESDLPILAERPVYFHYRGTAGRNWTGGHCVVGSPYARNYWCLAEGYTDPHFDMYICVSNPGKEDAQVTVLPLFGGGEPLDLTVGAGRRETIPLSSGEQVERAYAVYSDRGVVVERCMYFDYQGFASRNWDGGHCTVGAALQDIY